MVFDNYGDDAVPCILVSNRCLLAELIGPCDDTSRWFEVSESVVRHSPTAAERCRTAKVRGVDKWMCFPYSSFATSHCSRGTSTMISTISGTLDLHLENEKITRNIRQASTSSHCDANETNHHLTIRSALVLLGQGSSRLIEQNTH